MDLISKDISSIFRSSITLFRPKRSTVRLSMFKLCNDDSVFSNLSAKTPDVIAVNENHREVFILEVGCTLDYSLEKAFLTKMLKYHQLEQTISQLGYRCKLLVFIFGSLGHVHKLVVRGLQMAALCGGGVVSFTHDCCPLCLTYANSIVLCVAVFCLDLHLVSDCSPIF